MQGWALQLHNANDLDRQAQTLRKESDSNRCPVRESGGERCTRDRHDDDAHRISEKDYV